MNGHLMPVVSGIIIPKIIRIW